MINLVISRKHFSQPEYEKSVQKLPRSLSAASVSERCYSLIDFFNIIIR